jgi:hypothetical protein
MHGEPRANGFLDCARCSGFARLRANKVPLLFPWSSSLLPRAVSPLPIDNDDANVHVYWLSNLGQGLEKPGREQRFEGSSLFP